MPLRVIIRPRNKDNSFFIPYFLNLTFFVSFDFEIHSQKYAENFPILQLFYYKLLHIFACSVENTGGSERVMKAFCDEIRYLGTKNLIMVLKNLVIFAK